MIFAAASGTCSCTKVSKSVLKALSDSALTRSDSSRFLRKSSSLARNVAISASFAASASRRLLRVFSCYWRVSRSAASSAPSS